MSTPGAGVETLADVRRCYLEPDGRISVIRADSPASPAREGTGAMH